MQKYKFSDRPSLGLFRGGNTPSSRRKPRSLILAPLLLAALFIAFQYFTAETYTVPETGRTARVAMTREQEAALGVQSFRQVLSQSDRVQTGPLVNQVQSVAKRLINVLDPTSQSFDWAVEVIESEQMNAFCLPGGKIAVYTGILKVADTPDALAAVMGHEIAHATARHGAQRLFQQNLLQAALTGAQFATSDMESGERRLILGVLGAGAQYGVILPYGRDHETEADEIGLIYLIKAGFQPEASVTFWDRMNEVGGAQPPEWASTHPHPRKRMKHLEELIREYRTNGTVNGSPLS